MASPAPRPHDEKFLARLFYILRRATDCSAEEALEICRRAVRPPETGPASPKPLPPAEIVRRAWAECAARGRRRRRGAAVSKADLLLLLLELESDSPPRTSD